MTFRNLLLFACLGAATLLAASQTQHFVDCAAGNDAADGLHAQTAWKSLARASKAELQPGDSLLLKRGSTCEGSLQPKGSGAAARPILLDAYGTGVLPRIVGTGQDAGVKLRDQQYFEIAHLDVSGSSPYGILVTGTQPALDHFRITDVVIHDVPGKPKTKDTGLIVFAPAPQSKTVFNDVVIDGATAFNTTEWAGIIVSAGAYGKEPLRGRHVVIRNAVVHDVAGDGILLSLAKDGLIEHSVAWATGMEYSQSIGTPNGIWEWECEDCTVQYNEGFFTDSPGVDGGVYDIDWGNINNVVQYNFAHDTQGYCVAVFGAEGGTGDSNNSIVRGNLCLDNGRSPREAQRQGAIYLSTWNGGKLKGVEVYGNTVYWDPPVDAAAIVSDADIDPTDARSFEHNLVVSRVGHLVRTAGNLEFAQNQYWIDTSAAPQWSFDAKTYSSLNEAVPAGSQEKGSRYANPQWDRMFEPHAARCAGPRLFQQDVYGHSVPSSCDIGAVAPAVPDGRVQAPGATNLSAHYAPRDWTVLAKLPTEGRDRVTDDAERAGARSQMVVLQSMLQQFAPLGIHVDVLPAAPMSDSDAANWLADWNFGSVRLLHAGQASAAREFLGAHNAYLALLHDGKVIRIWQTPITAAELHLTLRNEVGTPAGMQTLPH